MPIIRPTYAEIDLSAIRDNIKAIQAKVGRNVAIMPAVKANAYGHGVVEVSKACVEAGASVLGVATPEEGIQLREAGFDQPILILGCSTNDAVGEIVSYDLMSTVCDIGFARALSHAAESHTKKAAVHIKVDTGMGRIGVRPEDALGFARMLRLLPDLHIDGIFTHFPCSDEPDRSFSLLQIAAFTKALSALRSNSINIPTIHMANSAGVLAFPESHFNAVRPGIAIYGSDPCEHVPHNVPLREAMTLKTHIVFIKDAQAKETIGYGRTHCLSRPSKIATLPIGYADGYQRALSNCGEAAVRGCRVGIVGRVCMDQIMIDVTDVDDVATGDEVILLGGGYDYLSANAVAAKAHTISDETYCAITDRVPRVYINA
ncbi:MAG: alanine racemase [Armatimonadetes bacterium]|nr:alanine racemase [Armatimonadota bacterium]